jgi:hypothetical protein
MTDRRSCDVIAGGKLSGCGVTAGIPARTMRAQVAALSDIGDVALGEGAVSPIANASGIEVLGDKFIVSELKQLVDPCDDVWRGSFAWRYGGPGQRQGSASTATQSHMSSDLGMLTHDGYIFDEKREDFLALAIDHSGIGPEVRHVTT